MLQLQMRFLRRGFGVIALSLAAAGAATWVSTAVSASRSTRVEGHVARLLHQAGTKDTDPGTYSPLVSFTLPGGQIIEFTTGMRSYPPAWKEGEAVGVLYDPANPQAAKLDSLFSLWLLPMVFAILTAVFGLVTGILWLFPQDMPLHSGWKKR